MLERAATAPLDLPRPPVELGRAAFLFLDFDGTLAPIAARPDAVHVDPRVGPLLVRLSARPGGAAAVLSGRSIEQLDALLGPVAATLPVAGSHGAEIRLAGRDPTGARPASLAAVAEEIGRFAASRPGVVAEIKSMGAAIHYRGAQALEAEAVALAERLSREHGLVFQRGKMVAEVRAPGSKGDALSRLCPPGAQPVMLGDDVTDEDAFAAAGRLGGVGVLVGDPRPTEARFRLPDVPAVLDWLGEVAA